MSNIEIFWKEFSQGGYKDYLIGLRNTAIIAVLGLVIGFIIGSIIALVKFIPSKKWPFKILKGIGDVYVTVLRGTPMVVQLLLVHFALFPMMGLGGLNTVVQAVIVFGFNSGAYMAEMIRSGVNAVDPGQMEAGRCVGLSYSESMIKIVLPQAVKNIIPTLGNEFIALLKETSIVSFIAVVDVTKSMESIANSTYEFFIPYIFLAITYLVIVLIISFGIKKLEKRLKKNERH